MKGLKNQRLLALTITFLLIANVTVFANSLSNNITLGKKTASLFSNNTNPTIKLIALANPKSTPITENNVKITKDHAIEHAKKFFKNESQYKIGYTNFSSNGNGEYLWNIQFSKNQNMNTNLNICINAQNGTIHNVNYYSNENINYQKGRIFTVTRQEALTLATKQIQDQYSIDMTQYQILPKDMSVYLNFNGGTNNWNNHNFSFVRIINGIPFLKDSLNIDISPITGNLINFNLINTYDSIKADNPKLSEDNLPKPEGVISANTAIDKYKSIVQMPIRYLMNYGINSNGYYLLPVYQPNSISNCIGAFTGNYVDYSGKDINVSKILNLTPTPPLVTLLPSANLVSDSLTRQEADQKADSFRSATEDLFKIKLKLTGSPGNSGNNSSNGDFTYGYNWKSLNSKDGNFNVSVAYNSKTGYFNSLVLDHYSPGKISEKLSWEKAKAKSLDYLKKLIPQQYGFFMDNNKTKPKFSNNDLNKMDSYSFSYTRVINGIRYDNNFINISINRTTGELRSFNMCWNDFNLQPLNSLIGSWQANSNYLNRVQATLCYQAFDVIVNGKPTEKTIRMLYKIGWAPQYMNSYGINALTGDPVDSNGRFVYNILDTGSGFYDGHPAAKAMELLLEQGILKKRTIGINEIITRVEAIILLNASILGTPMYNSSKEIDPSVFADWSSFSEYSYVVKNALSSGIIRSDEKLLRLTDPITKGEYVKYITNTLGMGDFKKHPELYTIPDSIGKFINIDGDTKASIAICVQLGILPVKEGEIFNLSDKMTFDEFCTSLYSSLKHIKR